MGSLFLVRHATTRASASGRNLGQADDAPLAPEGEELATAVGAAIALELASLPVEELLPVSSTARRCRRTLELALARIPVSSLRVRPVAADPELREIDYGSWEGLTAEECERSDPALRARWEADPYRTRCPAGESGEEVAARAFPVLDRLGEWLAGGRARAAIVVTHNHVIRLRLTATLGLPMADYRRAVRADPGGYSIITLGGQRPVIRRLNALPPPVAERGIG